MDGVGDPPVRWDDSPWPSPRPIPVDRPRSSLSRQNARGVGWSADPDISFDPIDADIAPADTKKRTDPRADPELTWPTRPTAPGS